MIRCGVVVCPIWVDIEGEYLVLIHYRREPVGPVVNAAYTRYNGILTDITDKFANLKLTPDWHERLASLMATDLNDHPYAKVIVRNQHGVSERVYDMHESVTCEIDIQLLKALDPDCVEVEYY